MSNMRRVPATSSLVPRVRWRVHPPPRLPAGFLAWGLAPADPTSRHFARPFPEILLELVYSSRPWVWRWSVTRVGPPSQPLVGPAALRGLPADPPGARQKTRLRRAPG